MRYPDELRATPRIHRLRRCLVAGLLAGACLTLLFLAASSAQSGSPVPLNRVATLWFATDGAGVAWGDVDGDGDLDLAVGNRLYLNERGTLTTTAAWVGDRACSVPAFGDADGDGDLDLAFNCYPWPAMVYVNNGGRLESPMHWNPEPGHGRPLWGDMDGDGYLDLALGEGVYHNEGGVLQDTPVWTDKIQGVARAWGDMNHDGHLDLAFSHHAFSGHIYVYANTGTMLGSSPAWQTVFGYPMEVAWGDVNDDGYPELAVSGNTYINGRSYVYRNVDGVLTTDNRWVSEEKHMGFAVAWGDVDGDGDLDLAVGTGGDKPERIYLNEGGELQTTAAWESAHSIAVYHVAWGDVDGDGDLDLAMWQNPRLGLVHMNESLAIQTAPAWNTTIGTTGYPQVAWGDVDGDGDLDLAVGATSESIYLNEGGELRTPAVWNSGDHAGAGTRSVAWADVDGDGDLDLAAGVFQDKSRIYLNHGLDTNGQLQMVVEDLDDAEDRTLSVAWGDVDGDGDLDLAVGNYGSTNKIYLNVNGRLGTTAAWEFGANDLTKSVAWGDVDGDGDLDLAVGNHESTNKIYLNVHGRLETTAAWESGVNEQTTSVAWGDMDGDGDLDLAVGNAHDQNKVYTNEGGTLQAAPAWTSLDMDQTSSLAWGDVDGDGDLDLAAGNWGGSAGWPIGPDRIYVNDGGMLQTAAEHLWTPTDLCATSSMAWGDMDGDGHLDLAVGQSHCDAYDDSLPENRPYDPPKVKVYLNQQCARSLGPGRAAALALDLNSDPVQTFSQTTTALAPANFYAMPGIRASGLIPLTYTLFHPSGGPAWSVRAFYSPDGGGRWREAGATTDTATTNLSTSPYPTVTVANTHVYTWDVFSSGFFGQSDHVVLRLEAYPVSCCDGITGTFRYTDTIPGLYQRPHISAQTFPFRVRGTQVRVYSGTVTGSVPISNALLYHLPVSATVGAKPLADAAGRPFRTDRHGYLQGRGRIVISDTLFALLPVSSSVTYAGALWFDGADDYVGLGNPESLQIEGEITIEAWVRTDATDGLRNLVAHGYTVTPPQEVYFRIADGNYQIGSWTGIDHYAAHPIPAEDIGRWVHLAGVYDGTWWRLHRDGEQVSASADSIGAVAVNADWAIGARGTGTERFFRGTLDEVRIWNVARTQDQIQAAMYRPLKGDEPGLAAYWRFDDPSDRTAFDQTANANGGTLHGPTWVGESLGGYTLYHTNARPTDTGLEGDTVQRQGVHELTVTAKYPLVLFDLNVSLEWDARKDTAFVEQLRFDLQRASEVLFDATNGQAALGNVTIYHDRERWLDADVRVYATNVLRPNAAIGGIRTAVYTEVVTSNPYAVTTLPYTVTYGPGQVRVGSVWNRFGEASGTLGEDWPRTLAHELGHYLFHLYDNYIGLDENRVIGPVDSCRGSLMTNPYLDEFSEFHPATDWTAECTRTLSAQITGRADWETITRFYPWLNGTIANAGPSGLPLAVTQIRESEIISPPTTLDVPIFYLTAEGLSYRPGNSGQAILYQDDRLIDLGRPSLDKVRVWGARVGDRLCVYEPAAERLGCKPRIESGDSQLELVEKPGWRPDVIVTPVTSRTFGLSVTVTGVSTDAVLKGRIYPVNAAATEPITLSPVPAKSLYTGTFALPVPSGEGYIQIWVNSEDDSEQNPRRELVMNYALGGNPGLSQTGFGLSQTGFGLSQTGFGLSQTGFAPVASTDGQVILYGDVDFEVGEFYALQKAASIPSPPPWATVVGDGYRLIASSPDLSFDGTSLNFRYLGREVPPSEESFLSLYYWDGTEWERLPTVLNSEYNEASAATRGAGLYVLMTSVEIPLYQPGWNLFSYPVRATRPVPQALLSIDDYYSIVYGYEATDTDDPWKVYGKIDGLPAPDWVNDLEVLEFGRGYWISVTEAITLYLKGGGDASAQQAQDAGSSFPYPPATYYGRVLTDADFTPAAGMTVAAWVGGNLCGQGILTDTTTHGLAYAVDVLAEDWGAAAGCGAPGRVVTFKIGSQVMAPTPPWDNNRLHELALRPRRSYRTYLPLVMRDHLYAPDLVVDRIAPTDDNDNLQVVIRNQGNGPVSDDFWVDLYVDPDPVPSRVNQIWEDLADEGVVWDVNADISPGDALTLTIGDAYTSWDHSGFSGSLAAGTWIYVQVDSANTLTDYGGVLEDHEITGGPYNNITGVKLSVPIDVGPIPDGRPSGPPGHPPPRPEGRASARHWHER